PGPDSAHMVGAIALGWTTLIVRCITGLARCEAAGPHRGPESRLDRVDNGARDIALDQGDGKTADREKLVRAEGCVDRSRLMINIDHIVEIPGIVDEP